MNAEQIEEYALANGHPPVAHGIILVDFDQTIRPWGGLFDFTEPYAGAHDRLHELKSQGYTLVLFTSRLSQVWHISEGRDPREAIYEQLAFLRSYCARFDLPFDEVTAEKIPSIAIIDDKAVEFRGSWTKARHRLTALIGTGL